MNCFYKYSQDVVNPNMNPVRLITNRPTDIIFQTLFSLRTNDLPLTETYFTDYIFSKILTLFCNN